MKVSFLLPSVVSAAIAFLCACGQGGGRKVTVYASADQEVAEPILAAFERKTGIKAEAKYDLESAKTVGLANAIRAEAGRPRCDLFWNNEALNTVLLAKEGLVQPLPVSLFEPGAPPFRQDPAGFWRGFSGRARVLVVNKKLLGDAPAPKSIFDLTDPKWKGRCGLAKPLFGTTATHLAAVYAAIGPEKTAVLLKGIRDNDVRILPGNRDVARKVADGSLVFGLTDTDDAVLELEAGAPLEIVYPDADGLGTLFIPNTVSIIKGAPHPAEAEALAAYLLSPEVEADMAAAKSAHIPLNPKTTAKSRVKSPTDTKASPSDWIPVADSHKKAMRLIDDILGR